MYRIFAPLFSLSRFRRFIFVVDLVALPLAVIAIWQSSQAIQLQIQSNEEQRVAAAWAQVANRATGNSGKGEAINTLFERGEQLSGLLLDCESMGGTYVKQPLRRCKGAPYIDGLRILGSFTPIVFEGVYPDLSDVSLDSELCDSNRPDIIDSDFSGSTIARGAIYCAMMIDVTIRDAWFQDTTIANSWLYNVDISGSEDFLLLGNRYDGLVAEGAIFNRTDFRNSEAAGINFTNAKFDQVNFRGLVGQDFNVSGAHFCYSSNTAYPPSAEHCPVEIPDSVLEQMWAWSDMPPVGIGPVADKLATIKRCSAEHRPANFGREFDDYGFVYDRGYKLPPQCSEARRVEPKDSR